MADRVVEKHETVRKEPSRQTIVIRDDERGRPRSNAWLIVAIIALVIILLLLFGRSLIGGGRAGSGAPSGTTGGSLVARMMHL